MVLGIVRLSFPKPYLTRINANHNIFVTKTGLDSLIVNIFIDIIKIMALKSNIIIQVKLKLAAAFSIIDIEPISFCLSLKVEHDQSK